jgi:tetratricopeptide (TPR) repeat protein
MSSAPHRFLAAALVVVLPSAAPALAQPAPSSPPSGEDAKARARAFVDAGLQAHERGDYDAAIAHYQQAYDLLPHPALFFNMGQAHRLAGRTAQALAMYQRYLAEVPTGALADQTRVWIAALEAAAEPEPGPPRPAPDAPPAPAPSAAVAPGEPRTRRNRLWTYAGIGTVGAGVVTAGVGGLYGLRALRLSDELSVTGAPYDRDKIERGERADDIMRTLYGIGGALVVGGAALILLAPDEMVVERGVSFAPMFAADHAGLTLSGTF